jgi:hypothetical protein
MMRKKKLNDKLHLALEADPLKVHQSQLYPRNSRIQVNIIIMKNKKILNNKKGKARKSKERGIRI